MLTIVLDAKIFAWTLFDLVLSFIRLLFPPLWRLILITHHHQLPVITIFFLV